MMKKESTLQHFTILPDLKGDAMQFALRPILPTFLIKHSSNQLQQRKPLHRKPSRLISLLQAAASQERARRFQLLALA